MLYSIDSGKYVEKLPHKKEFDGWMKNLPASDYQNIINALSQKIDSSDINTSSWIPGNDWSGTVYQSLYHACGNNKDASGLFFGLILFDLLMRREDAVWGFGRFEKNGVPIHGTTYFILNNPPAR
ncbi:hypothetical protein EDD66_10547 [Mobilisporobacter senegalensis]|uniref:Uncharacterized protein n=1 Tax=Mobilisporobacter senegalensis TaxID=1329262 RepID=A0A3N1XN40_9FIRM|nr:hypothetical protein [Mobilisporobacter senegalensis]ROR28109.1 hypothetical protein EDD66_10547 [Mobilisporobacter senegalensis]